MALGPQFRPRRLTTQVGRRALESRLQSPYQDGQGFRRSFSPGPTGGPPPGQHAPGRPSYTPSGPLTPPTMPRAPNTGPIQQQTRPPGPVTGADLGTPPAISGRPPGRFGLPPRIGGGLGPVVGPGPGAPPPITPPTVGPGAENPYDPGVASLGSGWSANQGLSPSYSGDIGRGGGYVDQGLWQRTGTTPLYGPPDSRVRPGPDIGPLPPLDRFPRGRVPADFRTFADDARRLSEQLRDQPQLEMAAARLGLGGGPQIGEGPISELEDARIPMEGEIRQPIGPRERQYAEPIEAEEAGPTGTQSQALVAEGPDADDTRGVDAGDQRTDEERDAEKEAWIEAWIRENARTPGDYGNNSPLVRKAAEEAWNNTQEGYEDTIRDVTDTVYNGQASEEEASVLRFLWDSGLRVKEDGTVYDNNGEYGSIYQPESLTGKGGHLYGRWKDRYGEQFHPKPEDPTQKFLDEARNLKPPEMDQAALEATIRAARQRQSLEASRAMRVGIESAARGRMGPGIQGAIASEVSHRAGVAGAGQEAQARLQATIQNYQAQMRHWDAQIANLRMAAQFAHDDTQRQKIFETTMAMDKMRQAAAREMARYQHELQSQVGWKDVFGLGGNLIGSLLGFGLGGGFSGGRGGGGTGLAEVATDQEFFPY